MDLVTEELVRVECAERQRAAERCALAGSSRLARLPLRVRFGLGLVALGERLSGIPAAAVDASVLQRLTNR